MMNATDEHHLRHFLVRYREALSAGDLKAISSCYAVPSLVLSDTGSVPIAAREEIETAFDGAAERYRAQGLVAVRPTLVASEALSEKLVSVDVRWDYLDEQGGSAQQSGYRYVLRFEDESSPKIQVVIETS
jgi:ketosteroid isomerase-like protein